MLVGKRPETLGFSDSSLCAGNQSPICGLFVVDIYYKAKINMLTIYNMVKWIWLIVFPDRIHQVIRNVFFNKAKIANISVCNQVIKFTTISEIKYKDNMFLSPMFGLATYSMTKLKFLNSSKLYKRCWFLAFFFAVFCF